MIHWSQRSRNCKETQRVDCGGESSFNTRKTHQSKFLDWQKSTDDRLPNFTLSEEIVDVMLMPMVGMESHPVCQNSAKIGKQDAA